jgi:hypothetical protein
VKKLKANCDVTNVIMILLVRNEKAILHNAFCLSSIDPRDISKNIFMRNPENAFL